ncbi:MAG: dimeric dUTPase (all-alpha-NTP-PPase superfamily) [Flavobacteriales bacterium]|jgi:dimeric dUTPase (all-alpha-NTP-PPase superfamily)
MNKELITMLELQDSMNSKVSDTWRDNGNAWFRAIWIECGELVDHYGWKWWKAQAPDMDQVELELIDIWHFGLSIKLEQEVDLNIIAETLERELAKPISSANLIESVEDFAQQTLATKDFDVPRFAGLLGQCNLSFSALFARYVGKNVLNFFRQDHGYKEGTYKKVWDGREDNEHLVEVLEAIGPNSDNVRDQIYNALKARYPNA